LKKVYRYIKNKKLLLSSKYKRLNVLWIPKIETEESLYREISRAVWYTYTFRQKINSIIFYISPEMQSKINQYDVPEYADDNINDLYLEMKSKLIFRTEEKFISNIYPDIVVYWSNVKHHLRIKAKFPFLVNASVHDNQFEANQIVKLSSVFLDKKSILENNRKLAGLLSNLKDENYQNVTIFGSGPSVCKYNEVDANNSLSIICNSVVKNSDLLKKIRPKIVVATDSVFHTGYSKYAAEFRTYLCQALDLIEEMVFIVPLRDLNIYKSNLPQKYQHRIYGLEGKKLNNFNIDLLSNQFVKSTSNVLTFFLFPIAATLSKNINILGFDGKIDNKEKKFWDYDQKSQFFNSICHTKKAHPAFYNVNYAEYYDTHCLEVESLVDVLKKKGIKIKNLAPSFIPALVEYND